MLQTRAGVSYVTTVTWTSSLSLLFCCADTDKSGSGGRDEDAHQQCDETHSMVVVFYVADTGKVS